MKQIARFAPVAVAMTLLPLLSLSIDVHAQSSDGAAPSNVPSAAEAQTTSNALSVEANCARFDQLNTRALQTETGTPACETMFPELGGARVWLADKGVGFSVGTFGPSYEYDVLGHNHNPQFYGGQDPNWSQLIYGTVTYDLSRIGFSSDAQFTLRGVWDTSNYPANDQCRCTAGSGIACAFRLVRGPGDTWPLRGVGDHVSEKSGIRSSPAQCLVDSGKSLFLVLSDFE